jgi:hypothetical protein
MEYLKVNNGSGYNAYVTIRGSHNEQYGGYNGTIGGYVTRSFMERRIMPPDVDMNSVTSDIDSQGMCGDSKYGRR